MNAYEQLLISDKAALEKEIAFQVEQQLKNELEHSSILEEVAKVIDYSCEITDTCIFQVWVPTVSGERTFSSVEDYQEKGEYSCTDDAEMDGVSWNGETGDGSGSFKWGRCPSVSVEVYGLTEDASKDAKTLWDALCEEQKHQEQLDWKRKRLEQAQKELLKLQADLAAAETNA